MLRRAAATDYYGCFDVAGAAADAAAAPAAVDDVKNACAACVLT